MTVPAVTRMGSWVLDRRGQGRGVRITRHPELHAINLSIWRESVCVGTVHLSPVDAAEVVQAITGQLAELARPAPAPPIRAAGRVDAQRREQAALKLAGGHPAQVHGALEHGAVDHAEVRGRGIPGGRGLRGGEAE